MNHLSAAMIVWTVSIAAVLTSRAAEQGGSIEVGLAARDITPEGPIWLAGYAGRKRPSDNVDSPLMAGACAIKGVNGERVVFISLDNCEVSREITDPVLRELSARHSLKPGAVMIVSSHTHSAPVVRGPLMPMYDLTPSEFERVEKYGRLLIRKLLEVAGAALADFKPSHLEHGIGRATFAMNRRVYKGDKVDFGENPDGPVDWDVPVLKIVGTNGAVRGILFGYACHGTSIAGEDFFTVSGDYMAYARQHLEAHYPGAIALYFTGMGADSNPSPRGSLLDSKRHGLELAGVAAGVLGRPMRPVRGDLKLAYEEVDLPLHAPPAREQLENDAKSSDFHLRSRAQGYLKILNEGKSLSVSVKLPLSAIRIGDDLTFIAMGGEVVVDYATRFKRLYAADRPWLIGYAYEVPCYIPSVRILKEGGYEADSSLIYYGIYGPFQTSVERILTEQMTKLVESVRGR
jgi:neutral/alkaline ceramidase-like enzyme